MENVFKKVIHYFFNGFKKYLIGLVTSLKL